MFIIFSNIPKNIGEKPHTGSHILISFLLLSRGSGFYTVK